MTQGARIEILSSGDAALDSILGGGIPASSVNVIAGTPGAGKTLFTIQMLFHLARQKMKSLYFTTLSEPAVKLVRYIQQFPFFDENLLDDAVQFVDVSTTLRKKGAEEAVSTLIARVEEAEPALVAIDSFKAVSDLMPDPVRHRTVVHDLAVHMAAWGATTFLVGEYSAEQAVSWPEFVIADGIILLGYRPVGLAAVRELNVLKLRGANYVTGTHFFDIRPDGVTFYPRVRAPEPINGWSAAERLTTGVRGLDDLLSGGFPHGSGTVVQGASGTGKTLFGLHFLMEGVRRGERTALFTLEETPDQLRKIAGGFAADLAAMEARGDLLLKYSSPVELSTDRFLNEVRDHVARTGARRVVLDSLTSLALGAPSESRFKELVYALTKHLRMVGASVLMTMEIPELLGSPLITGHGVSFAADNLVQLRYVEVENHLERAILIIKVRGVNHSTQLHRLKLQTGGLHVGSAMAGKGALLSEAPARGAKP